MEKKVSRADQADLIAFTQSLFDVLETTGVYSRKYVYIDYKGPCKFRQVLHFLHARS